MKRRLTRSDDPRKKRISHVQRCTNIMKWDDLAEDALSEVFNHFHHIDLLTCYASVCKKWKSVAEERIPIQLNFSRWQWEAFKSQSRSIAKSIRSISIKNCSLSSILRLEKVSLRAHHLSSLSAMRNLRHFEIVGERLWKGHLQFGSYGPIDYFLSLSIECRRVHTIDHQIDEQPQNASCQRMATRKAGWS